VTDPEPSRVISWKWMYEAIKLLAKRVPVLALVNNHFAGYAQETVRQLADALE